MRKISRAIRQAFQRQLNQPVEDFNRLQKAVRYALDLGRFCAQQLREDRASQMAAALTYRTIFSLVPTIILALLVFRAFISLEQAQGMLETKVYDYLNLDSLTAPAATDELQIDESNADGTTAETENQNAQESIKARLTEFVERGYSLNVASVGGVGLLLLVWAALALVVTVEQCFNRVFSCRTGRAWHHRIMLYWAVLTLGPALLMASMYLTGQIYDTATELPIVGAVFQVLGSFAALGASWLLLFLVYMLMPNTRVKVKPAMIGALVAAILWEFGKVGFKFYVTKAVTYSAIYGSLGLIPIFLLWMYLTWLIVLFGLELTHVLQVMPGRRFEKKKKIDERDLITDSRYVLPMMAELGDAFDEGETRSAGDLAQTLHLSESIAVQFCHELEEAGLVRQVDTGEYTLARPAERIAIADLLKLARSVAHLEDGQAKGGDTSAPTPGWALLAELNAAETDAARDRTLAHILQPKRTDLD